MVVTVCQIRTKIQKCDNEEVVKKYISLDYIISTENHKLHMMISVIKNTEKYISKEAKVYLLYAKSFTRNFYRSMPLD